MADEAEDSAGIEVTPEMVDAGVSALFQRDDRELGDVSFPLAQLWVATVLSAGLKART